MTIGPGGTPWIAHPASARCSANARSSSRSTARRGRASRRWQLARRLGLDFLDTGAMYRAAAAVIIDSACRGATRGRWSSHRPADIHFDWAADPPAIIADGRPMDRRIREADVTAIVSPVSAIRALREHLVAAAVDRQAAPAAGVGGPRPGLGGVPHADVKFYLDASPEVRARRRGSTPRGGRRATRRRFAEIVERDRSDSTRADGPLVCPPGRPSWTPRVDVRAGGGPSGADRALRGVSSERAGQPERSLVQNLLYDAVRAPVRLAAPASCIACGCSGPSGCRRQAAAGRGESPVAPRSGAGGDLDPNRRLRFLADEPVGLGRSGWLIRALAGSVRLRRTRATPGGAEIIAAGDGRGGAGFPGGFARRADAGVQARAGNAGQAGGCRCCPSRSRVLRGLAGHRRSAAGGAARRDVRRARSRRNY